MVQNWIRDGININQVARQSHKGTVNKNNIISLRNVLITTKVYKIFNLGNLLIEVWNVKPLRINGCTQVSQGKLLYPKIKDWINSVSHILIELNMKIHSRFRIIRFLARDQMVKLRQVLMHLATFLLTIETKIKSSAYIKWLKLWTILLSKLGIKSRQRAWLRKLVRFWVTRMNIYEERGSPCLITQENEIKLVGEPLINRAKEALEIQALI